MKKFIILLIIGILAIGAVSAYLLVGSKIMPNTQTKSDSSELQSDATDSKFKYIIYDGNTFIPATVNVKKGETVVIMNNTNKKVSIAITGKKASPIVHIEPNSTKSYPNIQEDGTYSFKNITTDIEKQSKLNSSNEEESEE